MKNQEKTSRHLKIIQGQLTGIEKMLTVEEPDCMEILTQLKSVQNSFRSMSQKVAQNMLERSFPKGINMKEKELKKFLDFAFSD